MHEARKNGLCAPPRSAGQSEQLQTFAAKSQQKPSVVANLGLADSLPAAGRGTVEQNLRGKRAQGAGGGEEGGRRTGAMAELSKLGDLGRSGEGERGRTVALRARRVRACVRVCVYVCVRSSWLAIQ